MAKKGAAPTSHVPVTIYLPPEYAKLLDDTAHEDRDPKSRWAARAVILALDARVKADKRREDSRQLDIETTTRRARR